MRNLQVPERFVTKENDLKLCFHIAHFLSDSAIVTVLRIGKHVKTTDSHTNQRCPNMHVLTSVEIPQSVSLINCQNTRRNSYYLMDTVRHKLGFEDFLHRAASQRRRLTALTKLRGEERGNSGRYRKAEQKDYYLFLSGKTIERCSVVPSFPFSNRALTKNYCICS